jgi:hypothetical protein
MKVQNEIHIYEIDGTELKVGESQELKINSHRTFAYFVNLVIPKTGQTITVSAADLEKAIRNATNWK